VTKALAIQATFSDFKLIRGRKVAQIICELPIEEADRALETLGGLPRPDREGWLALAPLNVTSIRPRKEGRKWDDLKLAMQAGIRCNEEAFWAFIRENWPTWNPRDEKTAASFVRTYCGIVGSREQLNDNPRAAAKWVELDTQFQLWMREPQHA
jgi:hypothetical protein